MPRLLIDEFCHIIGCDKDELHIFLQNPSIRNELMNFGVGKVLRTTFTNELGTKFIYYFQQLSTYCAKDLKPFKKFPDQTIEEYFSSVHQCKLLYPQLPCITCMNFSEYELHFQPIELLELFADYIAIPY